MVDKKPEQENNTSPENKAATSQEETDVNQEKKNHDDETQQNLAGSFKRFIASVRDFLRDRLSIQDNAQPEKTIEGIERDIDFRGFNLWILIPAILIASVGLNANSTAVVVGAMLISPLMGPIIGLGLSIGINDFNMLKRSLRNLGIAVAVSVATSAIFFFLIPIDDASSELLARTKPDIRDVFIAFFGGFAGILAGSRKEKNNVIPGVAIATALMPPLCTAGYGIATFQFHYFLGASYLFLINAFFIALASVLVVRYLRFPVRTFVNKQTQRKAKRWLAFSVIVMILPASYIFFNVVQETFYLRKVNTFIDENIQYDDAAIVKKDILRTDSISYVDLVIFGQNIPEKTIRHWQNILNKTVEKTKLRIFQGTDEASNVQAEKLVNMFTDSQNQMASKEERIKILEEQVKNFSEQELPPQLLAEIKINYPDIASIKMGRMIYADFSSEKTQEQPDFFIFWSSTLPDTTRLSKTLQLKKWLEMRLAEDSVGVTSATFIPQPKHTFKAEEN